MRPGSWDAPASAIGTVAAHRRAFLVVFFLRPQARGEQRIAVRLDLERGTPQLLETLV